MAKPDKNKNDAPLIGSAFLQLIITDSHTIFTASCSHDRKIVCIAQLLDRVNEQLLAEIPPGNSILETLDLQLYDHRGSWFGVLRFTKRVSSYDFGPGYLTFTVSLDGNSYFENRDVADEIALMTHELKLKVLGGSTKELFTDDDGVRVALFQWNQTQPVIEHSF